MEAKVPKVEADKTTGIADDYVLPSAHGTVQNIKDVRAGAG